MRNKIHIGVYDNNAVGLRLALGDSHGTWGANNDRLRVCFTKEQDFDLGGVLMFSKMPR